MRSVFQFKGLPLETIYTNVVSKMAGKMGTNSENSGYQKIK
jgi:hypothetical protein